MGLSGKLQWALSASLVAAVMTSRGVDAWVPHIISKGNKFFNSETGQEFRMKGMAYYPRPNAGELYNVDNYDWTLDIHEDVWRPHIEIMKDLGVNTIRLYSVDPGKSHDKFMCACSEAGIYVLVGMAAPCKDCVILDEEPPACYPSGLFTRAQMVYNAFAVYDNVLGFSVGNENNLQTQHGASGTTTAPCVKAFLRDVRRYARSCATALRDVPIGLDIADTLPREQWLQYYDCSVDDDELTRAQWVGFNPYVECDPVKHTTYDDSTGLQTLMADYAASGYSRPIMFGEFGCNKGNNTIDGYEKQRAFYDAKWMNEESDMTAEVVGGNVFEFSTERNHLTSANDLALTTQGDDGKYGIGYFDPIDCDHLTTPCTFVKYPEYENLKLAYTTTKRSTLRYTDYKPIRDKILTCPSEISADLPPMPEVETLECASEQPVCNHRRSNAFTKDESLYVALGTTVSPSNAAPKRKFSAASPSGSGSGSDSEPEAGSSSAAPNGVVSWVALMASVAIGAILL